ncbi:hypothetical protein BKA62DRAFT_803313 [Auriculariales sp. MPI-PUGE-AT-0066]|nr:hypothetical protein BKA62DRAFT_803313 [Auriculariales sp. MPI-PUGE-AT-0066]
MTEIHEIWNASMHGQLKPAYFNALIAACIGKHSDHASEMHKVHLLLRKLKDHLVWLGTGRREMGTMAEEQVMAISIDVGAQVVAEAGDAAAWEAHENAKRDQQYNAGLDRAAIQLDCQD